jgi:hypothetical protein
MIEDHLDRSHSRERMEKDEKAKTNLDTHLR